MKKAFNRIIQQMKMSDAQNNFVGFETNQPSAAEGQETYGLSINFLNALKISLPLINRIFVGNLSPLANEAKLREVFSYAGQIIQIIYVNTENQKPMAKIEFDHPVEAVQAIAMFHNQELYGKPMLVQLDTLKKWKNIPKGLKGFGPGLGPNGEPLHSVRMHIELRPLKTLLMEEINKLRQTIKKDQVVQPLLSTPVQESNLMNPCNPVTAWNLNTFVPSNPLQNLSRAGQPQGLNNLQLLQNLMQQNLSNNRLTNVENQFMVNQTTVPLNSVNTIADMSVPGISENKQNDWIKSSSDYNHREGLSRFNEDKNIGEKKSRKRSWKDRDDRSEEKEINSDMLVFTNLPRSVTVQVLKAKVREVGDMKFVDFTGNGRALVRFFRSADAERCQKLFNESKVDGRVINVKFF